MEHYQTARVAHLFEVYGRHLEVAIAAAPTRYSYPLEEAPLVVERMKAAAAKKGIYGIAIDSAAWKATTKELGLRHTYRELSYYLEGKTGAAPPAAAATSGAVG